MSASKQRHIGIVGAGFAGLRCADVLLQQGHRVMIFEARDRIGGRVAQSDYLGHKIDLGPNWIHGTDGNPILELARKTGTRLHAWDEAQQIYDVDKTPLDAEDAALYGGLLWDNGLIADAFKYSEQNKDSISSSVSLFDFFRDKVGDLFTDLDPDEAARRRRTLLNITKMWGAYVGSPIERQSLKFYWLEECIEGENPFVAETYYKILPAVAERALKDAVIRLNVKVLNISAAQGTAQPTIGTADGVFYAFDEVVVTTPLGWLKRNSSAFVPPLTQPIRDAIENIGYGCLDKVYITFHTAWWNESTTNGVDNGTKLDKTHSTPNVTSTSMPLHQSDCSMASSSNYPGFTHWLDPQYDPTNNPEQWDIQAMNLAALPGDFSHPTLLFYIQGPCSQHVASLVRSAKSDLERDTALVEFFKPYYSLMPNYSPGHPDCIPKAILATAWANDEYAGYGSYSNFQVGLEHGDKDIETLRHGMPEKHLWFAGEHTAPFVALGTTTGAYWSGEKVAERILQSYDKDDEANGS
ncbi:Lysine-specific histone demethylase 1A [Sphaceloma murrayae]|uniref:Lysine-specific histone demethylase 1A n=1 Tax=Sphaceloma murrayae TaxID=2082308 RepID=A0A2K1QML2_9PEZI|nr:Lysine-specific histone demethylase 1A [Sphaceloma murrayae]